MIESYQPTRHPRLRLWDGVLSLVLLFGAAVALVEWTRFADNRTEACRLRWHQVAVLGDSVHTAERCGAAPVSRP